MRLNTVTLFILFLAVTSFGQDHKCSVKLADLPAAPELFGFRMGMTTDQLKQRVPQVVFGRANDFGLAQTSISPDFDTRIDKAGLAGIRTISFDFLDGRLTSLWFGFDSSFKWNTVADFVQGLSQALHLPTEWETWKVRGQQLRCADFQMTVSLVAEAPSFHIVDETAAQTIAARRAELEAESEDEVIADRRALVYYLADCQPSKEINEADKVIFKTKEAAEKAGYKAAKGCQ